MRRPRWGERVPNSRPGVPGDVGRQTGLSGGANRRQLGSRPFNLNRVIFEVIATIPDAEATLEAIKKRYGRTGRGLKITNGKATGQNLWLWFECVVKGAHRGGAGVERLSSLIWQPVTLTSSPRVDGAARPVLAGGTRGIP
jgi:hypothetical protein